MDNTPRGNGPKVYKTVQDWEKLGDGGASSRDSSRAPSARGEDGRRGRSGDPASRPTSDNAPPRTTSVTRGDSRDRTSSRPPTGREGGDRAPSEVRPSGIISCYGGYGNPPSREERRIERMLRRSGRNVLGLGED